MPRDLRRALPGYLLGAVLLTFYGGVVCPLMQAEDKVELASVLACGFSLAIAIEWLRSERIEALPLGKRWELQWAFWLLPGLLVAAWNALRHSTGYSAGALAGSGLKITVGCVALGLFVSCDRSLREEHGRIIAGTAKPETTTLWIADRIRGFVSLGIGAIAIVTVLIAWKNANDYEAGRMHGKPWQIVAEVLFAMTVLSIGVLRVVRHYHHYMQKMFEWERDALRAVATGNLDVSVPVVSRDEFGEIADGTNKMIDGLREREKIRRAFGKVVGSKVATKLLAGEIKLGGEQREAAVLFTDLRGYTSLSEKLSAEQVVTVLNEYFTKMVAAVYENDGSVDKFIGDALMAEFGLFGEPDPCAAAFRTALAMREALRQINRDLANRGLPAVDNGIGIHFGPLVAGQIGSADRLEYTAIGDCVNVASRLESLTRKIESPIAISTAVYERLPDELRRRVMPVGEHELKGKSVPLLVYGVAAAAGDRKAVTAG